MGELEQFLEKLTQCNADVQCTPQNTHDATMLSTAPKALQEFYHAYANLQLPFGDIYPLKTAISRSKAEPFHTEGWFCFGFDGYFSFWLCKVMPDAANLSFTTWDHDSGSEIGDAIYETLCEFLKDAYAEYIENN